MGKIKVIIAGSRTITNYKLVEQAVIESGFTITEVVSGKCPKGIDILGERWAQNHNIPVKEFPADWNNIDHPQAVIKINTWGKEYAVNAGFLRNQLMSEYAEGLIAITNGSNGTADMIERAYKAKLEVYILNVT